VNNAATVRKLALAMMVIAILTGFGSLFLLMTGRSNNPTLMIISAVCLIAGLVFDRRAGKLDI